MAKKRTKKDKQKAELRKRRFQTVQTKSSDDVQQTNVRVEKLNLPLISQANHDLIRQDLRKTLAITLFILLVLFTIALLYT